MVADIQAAAGAAKRDRAQFRAGLNNLFRAGRLPSAPLQGRLKGALVLLDVAPGLTQLLEALTANWLPWLGKTFDSNRATGDNIFTQDSRLLIQLLTPFYRGVHEDGPGTYRAFTFQTYVAPGLFDPDCQVLKIDYDLPANPALTIRRVLDEIVELREGVFLGKAHVKWWWGRWGTVAYFMLEM